MRPALQPEVDDLNFIAVMKENYERKSCNSGENVSGGESIIGAPGKESDFGEGNLANPAFETGTLRAPAEKRRDKTHRGGVSKEPRGERESANDSCTSAAISKFDIKEWTFRG